MLRSRGVILRRRLDLRPLLGLATRGDAVAVLGVRVGEPATKVERARLDDAELTEPIHEGHAYRASDDDLRARPLAERVARVCEGTGWLRGEGCALRVERGLIARIFVRGAALSTLEIDREADVRRCFGAPDGIERTCGAVAHHYPARALVVSWSAREGRLEHVALGPDSWKEPRYGARELLTELLVHWRDLKAHRFEEPAEGSIRARFHRLSALARALELGALKDVTQGAFTRREPARYAALLEDVARRGYRPRDAVRPHTADTLYRFLLDYRVDVERVLGATRGWLECSDPALLGMIATQTAIARSLREAIEPVDAWLCRLLDPEGRTFGERELIERFGWPDVDIMELELEEL